MSFVKTLSGSIEYPPSWLILSNNLDNDNPLLRGARGFRRLGF